MQRYVRQWPGGPKGRQAEISSGNKGDATMAEYDAPQQDWLKPQNSFAADSPGSAAPPPRAAIGYDLRPLSTGEILDRTFILYRSRFWLFAGLSSIGACVSVLSGMARLALPQASAATAPRAVGLATLFAMLGALLALVAYSITQAATTSAVSALYLGEETSMGKALRSVGAHWLRYPLIAIWQAWSMIWIFFLLFIPVVAIPAMGVRNLGWLVGLLIFLAFASLVYGIIAYLRNSLAVPASVIEALTVPTAMQRSKLLSDGTKGRLFLLLLLLGALSMVAATLQVPFAMILLRARSTEHIMTQALSLLVNFLTGTVVGPVGAIALCLFYFDQRVRKEAFDIEFLMERSAPPIPQPASTEPV
jgi:hypothetical protein